MGDDAKPDARRATEFTTQYSAGHGDLGLGDFLKRARAAGTRIVQGLAGASALGMYLAEGASQSSVEETYKPRTVWNDSTEARRTKYVTFMGSAAEGRQEVWLILWSRDRSEMQAIERAAARDSGWRKAEERPNGRTYERGPVTITVGGEAGTASLIYKEARAEPFGNAEYCERLGGLFEEVAALLAARPGAPAPEAPAAGTGADAAAAETDEDAPSGADLRDYATPADLVAALASGSATIYHERVGVGGIRGHRGEIAVADDIKGKKIVLTVAGIAGLDPDALSSAARHLGDPTFSVRPSGGDGVTMGRVRRSMPTPKDIGAVLDYAERLLARLDEAPRGTGPLAPEAAPAPPPEAAEVPSAAAPAGEVRVELPRPDELEPGPGPVEAASSGSPGAPEGEALPQPRPEAEPDENGIVAEEVSLEELLGPAAGGEEGPAPQAPPKAAPPPPAPEAAPAIAEPAVPASPARRVGPPASEGAPLTGGPAPQREAPRAGPPPAAFPPPDIKLPKDFGKYRALRCLGRDVLGYVYQAEHVETKEPVALKVIDKEHAHDRAFAEDFVRGGWSLAKLDHPNLRRILSVGRAPGHVYYCAAEFIEAASVRGTVEAGGAMSVREAVRVVLAVAGALRYAHERKIVHGDVRPSHVLLTPDGGVKLTELGIAKGVRDSVGRLLQGLGWRLSDLRMEEEARAAAERILRERSVTTWCLAPEAVALRSETDARSDIYGLGGVFYYMVTGRPPFADIGALAMLLGQRGDLVPPSEVGPGIPAEVNRIILKMMETFPEPRHQSAAELQADLESLKIP